MSTSRVETEIPFDKILKSVEHMSLSDLEKLMNQVTALQARRKAPFLSKDESELMLKINKGLPSGIRKRFGELAAKRRAENLTTDEHKKLLHLSDRIEKSDAERMKNILELARIRGVDLEVLMEEMNLFPHAHA